MLAGYRATVMAGGHSHSQLLRRFGEATLINPGSVGQPIVLERITGKVRHPAWAEYALVTWQAGNLRIDLRRTPYDTAEVIRTALTSGMPHAKWWVWGWTADEEG